MRRRKVAAMVYEFKPKKVRKGFIRVKVGLLPAKRRAPKTIKIFVRVGKPRKVKT